jgi:DNA-directed RNA polymerase specialized sigma24 family protein
MSAPEEMAAPEETVATGTIAVSESRPIREYLSRTEVAEAIRSLTDAEKTKLMKYARIQAAKTPYDGEDLFQEALTRCLEQGRRPWPRDVSVLGFLAGVTKSIASEWKDDPSPDPTGEPSSGDEELKAIARIDTDKVIKLFDDDLIAQSIVISMIFGARGEELRRSSGLSEIEYESKRKKIRRRLEKYLSDVNS